jgi:hypothetical protein
MPDEWTDEGAVLIVRVWSEPPHDEESFRARVVKMSGARVAPVSAAVASPDAVIALVKGFLEEYAAGPRPL